MKKLILVGLFIVSNVFAEDGTVTWSTFLRPLPCNINHNINPITLISAQCLSDTYHWEGSPISGIVYTPRSIPVGSYTTVSSGSMTAGLPSSNLVHWVIISRITYDSTCCSHSNGMAGIEVRDVAEFTGGGQTNEIRSSTNIIYIGSSTKGTEDIYLEVKRRVSSSERVADVETSWSGQGIQCSILPTNLQQFFQKSGTNKSLHIRGTTDQSSTTALLYTNSLLNTNWVFATPVTLDSSGNADIDMSSWNLPDNQLFFNLNYTNNP